MEFSAKLLPHEIGPRLDYEWYDTHQVHWVDEEPEFPGRAREPDDVLDGEEDGGEGVDPDDDLDGGADVVVVVAHRRVADADVGGRRRRRR